jgi:hypothetical protein
MFLCQPAEKVWLDRILANDNMLKIVALTFQGSAMSEKTKPSHLWQEITLTLALKVFVLFIIWAVWFSAPQDINLDDQAVASKILSQQSLKEPDHDADRRAR